MKRRIVVVVVVASCAFAVLVIACAKAPEPRTNATTESSIEPTADAGQEADVRVPGLPMPQQFPRLAWDAAGVPRDAR
jgi:hypothetical protein